MIIVSQDKRNILNFDFTQRIGLDRETNFSSIIAYQNGNASAECMWLGNYKTEERAKKVLQEILKKYEIGMSALGKNTFSFVYEFVYEMPED